MSFTSFAGAMTLVSKTDSNGKFFAYCVKMFCGRYAEGAYYDAAVWGRRAAEVYCLVLLGLFQYDLQNGFHGLAELAWYLPEWVWQYTAYHHVKAYGGYRSQVAEQLGMQLSQHNVYEDLDCLRKYGNKGAHASRYLQGERLGPDPTAVLSLIRIAMSDAVWQGCCSKI